MKTLMWSDSATRQFCSSVAIFLSARLYEMKMPKLMVVLPAIGEGGTGPHVLSRARSTRRVQARRRRRWRTRSSSQAFAAGGTRIAGNLCDARPGVARGAVPQPVSWGSRWTRQGLESSSHLLESVRRITTRGLPAVAFTACLPARRGQLLHRVDDVRQVLVAVAAD